MKTAQTDATGTQNDVNGTDDQPSVIVAPELMADGATQDAGTPKVEKTEDMPQVPPAAVAAGTDVGAAGAASAPAAPTAPTATADNGGDEGKDDEEQLPTNDGRLLKHGLLAAAILGVIALFGLGYVVVRNTANAPATSVTTPASTPAPAAPLPLPEVRTPAPRLIDATNCRPGQYHVEGNQLVFTGCATLELAAPTGR